MGSNAATWLCASLSLFHFSQKGDNHTYSCLIGGCNDKLDN